MMKIGIQSLDWDMNNYNNLGLYSFGLLGVKVVIELFLFGNRCMKDTTIL